MSEVRFHCAPVSTVIATRGRGELLRRAVRSIAAQDYTGDLEVVIVYDQCEVDDLGDLRAELPDHVQIVTCSNERSPGLAGGRNTGISRARGHLVAFCDDDDEWTTDKLRLQVTLWNRDPGAVAISSGMRIITADGEVVRTPPATVTHEDLLRSRVGELHPSSMLFRAGDLRALPGGVDEDIPFSYGEDYDLLLRLTERGHISSVPEPVVLVHWDRVSYFAGRWEAMAAGLSYLLDKHPRLLSDSANAARMSGQVGFALAAGGERRRAGHWVRRALRHRFLEPRAWLTLLAFTRLVSPQRITTALNRRGRGI